MRDFGQLPMMVDIRNTTLTASTASTASTATSTITGTNVNWHSIPNGAAAMSFDSLTNYVNGASQAIMYSQPLRYRRPDINLNAVSRFRLETPSTNPVIARNPERPTAGWWHAGTAVSRESRIRRNNWKVMKLSVQKRTRSASIFKTCMITGTPYGGRVYRFEIGSAGIGTWFVGPYPVMIVDMRSRMIRQIMIPIPSIVDNPKPGIINLTRFLFRMLGLGAVRDKDHSLISTSSTSKKLAPGERWAFSRNEIGNYRYTDAQLQENSEDLRQRLRDLDPNMLPDIRGPRVRSMVEEIQIRESSYGRYARLQAYEGPITEEWIPPTTFTI